ncbi:hypothetical protein [Aeromicrobium sp. UC242_57]|uniref:hypothetical protein n=1 Tax=Aeromicrobium sp. UC242_57 TaxID=3374624 RepID=UPI0037B8A28C
MTIVVDASALEGMSDRHVLTVVAQTHTAWEMLVAVEPGIRGRRSGYVKRLIAVDARIRTIETSELPIQVDTLIRAADGDVVAFWDGREHWAPRFLELGLPALDDHGVVAAAVAEGASFDQLISTGMSTWTSARWSASRGRVRAACEVSWRSGA